jgi:hypothetical protein
MTYLRKKTPSVKINHRDVKFTSDSVEVNVYECHSQLLTDVSHHCPSIKCNISRHETKGIL